jgi:hypothetical protein
MPIARSRQELRLCLLLTVEMAPVTAVRFVYHNQQQLLAKLLVGCYQRNSKAGFISNLNFFIDETY